MTFLFYESWQHGQLFFHFWQSVQPWSDSYTSHGLTMGLLNAADDGLINVSSSSETNNLAVATAPQYLRA